ncbi:MAG: tRNA uridine-5-carboxymethylaminomethyl(34) synthesis GTPase MnmE [Candidatus Eremiobacteraeota bacterium]|nr:tRNA uridine-5-carboxymethylaminomethyl(34) synthesis GTPase MnmE [Candidatus Eremiobacteraeota bacterium]
MNLDYPTDTIVALATPPGYGAIAIIRVSGPAASDLAARHFRAQRALEPHVATYGDVLDENGELIDCGVAILAPSPHSYTGEDALELHVHGSPIVARELIRALIASGARLAQPGEFTKRSFLNGKLDLHAARSVADLINAEHRSAARAALANMGSALAREVRAIRESLSSILEELAASIDFSDEVPEPDRASVTSGLLDIESRLEALLANAEVGRLVREGLDVAIVGPPNAGKSSLLNALLGEERAIVSEVPGTTRDTIEEAITIDGVSVRLTDTAGVREDAQTVEAMGIERTRRAVAGARLAIVVIDASVPIASDARDVLSLTSEIDRIVYFNKSDLGDVAFRDHCADANGAILGNVFDAATLGALRGAIAKHGWDATQPDLQRPTLAAAYEVDAASTALRSLQHARETLLAQMPMDLIAPDLQTAFASLGKLTGDAVTEEMLDRIFSRFCIGK